MAALEAVVAGADSVEPVCLMASAPLIVRAATLPHTQAGGIFFQEMLLFH